MNKHEDIINPQPAMSVSAIQQGLVSIITPNYNGGRLLPETMDSVLAQTFQNWEMIVVDDGSTDDSIDILEQYSQADARIRYIPLLQNSGIPAIPRNRGIEEVRGEYIAFLDADDVWHPEKLEIQIEFMKTNGVEFCFTKVLPFKNSREYESLKNISHRNISFKYKQISLTRLLVKNPIKSCSSTIIRRDVLNGIRFNTAFEYRAIEDYLFWLDVHQHCIHRSYRLDNILVFYRLAGNSISRSKVMMAKKHYHIYSHYQINGRPLGWKKYVYFLTYATLSLVYISMYALLRRRIMRLQ